MSERLRTPTREEWEEQVEIIKDKKRNYFERRRASNTLILWNYILSVKDDPPSPPPKGSEYWHELERRRLENCPNNPDKEVD